MKNSSRCAGIDRKRRLANAVADFSCPCFMLGIENDKGRYRLLTFTDATASDVLLWIPRTSLPSLRMWQKGLQ